MAVGQRGLSSSLDARRIREPLFTTVKRGYDPKQVLEYLSVVADEVEALQSRMQELESDLGEAHSTQESSLHDQVAGEDPYDRLSAHVADVIRTFDQDVDRLQEEKKAEADRIVAEARTEADRILSDARTEADRIRSDAQGNAEEARAFAERTVRDAEDKAVGAFSRLASRREALLNDLRTIRDHIIGATRNLDAVVEDAPSGDQLVVVEDAKDSEHANASSFPSPGGTPQSAP